MGVANWDQVTFCCVSMLYYKNKDANRVSTEV